MTDTAPAAINSYSKPRAYAGGFVRLDLDQFGPLATLISADGAGSMNTDVLQSPVGTSLTVDKFSGKPKYGDITVVVGAALTPKFYRLISDVLEYKAQKLSGAIVYLDSNNRPRSSYAFSDAYITGIDFPSLDAKSNTAAQITIRIKPGKVEYKAEQGAALSKAQANMEQLKQKMWTTNRFGFVFDANGDNKDFGTISVGGLSIKHNVIENPVGNELIARLSPGRLELPELTVKFSETLVGPFMKWYEDKVVRANRGTTTASIEYRSQDNTKSLFALDLYRVGLKGLTVDKNDANSANGIVATQATFFFSEMKVRGGAGTV